MIQKLTLILEGSLYLLSNSYIPGINWACTSILNVFTHKQNGFCGMRDGIMFAKICAQYYHDRQSSFFSDARLVIRAPSLVSHLSSLFTRQYPNNLHAGVEAQHKFRWHLIQYYVRLAYEAKDFVAFSKHLDTLNMLGTPSSIRRELIGYGSASFVSHEIRLSNYWNGSVPITQYMQDTCFPRTPGNAHYIEDHIQLAGFLDTDPDPDLKPLSFKYKQSPVYSCLKCPLEVSAHLNRWLPDVQNSMF